MERDQTGGSWPIYRAALWEDEAAERQQLFAKLGVEAEIVAFPTADALFRRGGTMSALPGREIRWIESRDHGVAVFLRDRERTVSLSHRGEAAQRPGGPVRRG